MKRKSSAFRHVIFAVLGLLLFGTGFAQPKSDLETVKERALESARFVLKYPRYGYTDRSVHNCVPKAKRLHAGKPFFIHALVHPTKEDLQRLQQHIRKAQHQEPNFVTVRETDFFYNYRDRYRVPIFDQSCGYLFHVTPETNSKAPLFVGNFRPLPLREAQKRLSTKDNPVFVWFYTSLTPLREGYLWVAGSKAIEAFNEHTIYRIVDRLGKPVSPLETKLKTQIFRESFVTPDGKPSAYWHFGLAIKLEPLPAKP